MQIVSDKWKRAHRRTILGESFVEVSLDVADPDALVAAEPSDNGAIYISDSSRLTDGVDKNPTPYCTLEQNLWLLNGARKALPESDYGDSCYIGDVLCNDVCVFSDKIPIISISFGETFDKLIPGITITWSSTYGEFADNFIVRALSNGYVYAEKEVVGNKSVTSLVMMDIDEYDTIEIYITKWCLPHRRARVEEVFVGMHKVYSKTDLFNYTHKQTVDPVSTSLPKSEIKFSIDNVDNEYNPYNTDGMAKYLMERQEVKARYGLKVEDGTIEWINGGTFYLSEWYAKQNGITADFTARDLLEFMSATFHDTHTSGSRKLYDLATLILSSANLPLNSDGSVKWYVDESLRDNAELTTTAPLPEDTFANCLQLIANAACCTIAQDRDGILRIEPLKFDTTDYEINSFNSYAKPEMELAKPIKQVIVKMYTYSGDSSTTTEVVVNGNGGALGEVITIDNPLITSEKRAKAVGEWLATHLGHRMTLDSSWRADTRLDALDIIKSDNGYNKVDVRVTDVEFKYNGAFRGTGKGKVI